jgi:hypothetical protein
MEGEKAYGLEGKCDIVFHVLNCLRKGVLELSIFRNQWVNRNAMAGCVRMDQCPNHF